MKKLFVAVLALAALAACNKEEADLVLDSSKKSVTISVANLSSDTRYETTPSNDAGEDLVCATDATLNVIFTDASSNKVTAVLLNSGIYDAANKTYTFHQLPESVKGFFVVGSRAKALDYASVSAAEAAWKADQQGAEWNDVVVYGLCEDWANDNGATCQVEGKEYLLYTGSVKVAPYKARIEISAINCDDLGDRNRDYIKDGEGNDTTELDLTTVGYEKATVTKMGIKDTLTELTNLGTMTADPAVKALYPATGKVWSWNVDPAAVADYLVYLDVTVDAEPFYSVVNAERSIKAEKYAATEADLEGVVDGYITEFLSGHVYKMTVPFSEKDLDDSSSLICVEVSVEIADWVVHTITPEF